ncbi:MAG: DUF4834 family protein [Massilibacteroides sp.]|nr:DUF4834 family protein [Massilibacteroides sp.]
MFKFIFVMFFFFMLLLFLLGFSVLRTFKNILFGKGNSTNKEKQQRATSNRQQTNRSEAQYNTTSRKKIIGEEEGEYVDYEEVKNKG